MKRGILDSSYENPEQSLRDYNSEILVVPTIDHVVVVPRRVIVPPLYLMHHMSPLIENILQYIRG